MFEGKSVLGLIPARGGSKGIKDKNIIDLCGKPLIGYTVEAALDSSYIDDVVVTTDSEKIAECARQFGAQIPFMRPEKLASDTSKTIDAVLHAIAELEKMGKKYDCLVLLQPTQPLRTSRHIDEAVELFFSGDEKSVVSICEVDDNPLLMRRIGENGRLIPLLDCNSTCRRQDMPKYYRVNGCIYVNKVADISDKTSFNDNEIPYLMNRENSVDIDEEMDIKKAEMFLTLRKNGET